MDAKAAYSEGYDHGFANGQREAGAEIERLKDENAGLSRSLNASVEELDALRAAAKTLLAHFQEGKYFVSDRSINDAVEALEKTVNEQ